MFKYKLWLSLFFIFILFALTACNNNSQSEGPNINGIVSDIHRDSYGNLMNILVEEQVKRNPDVVNISIQEETLIVEDGKLVTGDAIFIGLSVEAWYAQEINQDMNTMEPTAEKITILDIAQKAPLKFSPVDPIPLKPGKPPEDWILEGLVDFSHEFDGQVREIYLYKKDFQPDPLIEEIFAFIMDENDMYEIGKVTNYGIRSIGMDARDVTYDEVNEIILDGSIGATYVETKIIGQDKDGNWVIWLCGGSYSNVDLDGSGQKEWVATSRGSLPPYVVIYRWNGQYFEWADVSAAVGGNYANIIQKNNQWIIESGMWKLDNDANEYVINKRSYLYRGDHLINKVDI